MLRDLRTHLDAINARLPAHRRRPLPAMLIALDASGDSIVENLRPAEEEGLASALLRMRLGEPPPRDGPSSAIEAADAALAYREWRQRRLQRMCRQR
jgi:hypothetical protein